MTHGSIDEGHSDGGYHAGDHLNFIRIRYLSYDGNTHHVGGEVHLQCILHLIKGARGGGIGTQLETRVKKDEVNCRLRVAELEHPVAGEHGEKVPGEEGDKGDEKE